MSEAGRAAKDAPGGLKFTGQIHSTIDYRKKPFIIVIKESI